MQIGTPPWDRDKAIAALPEFFELYKERPIKDNKAGMRFPHMFATWYMLKQLAPPFVIESGIWQGQSTWLIEQVCSRVVSLDIDLEQRKYISPDVEYFETDLSTLETGQLPEGSVVFFDDHQDAYTRILQSRAKGYKHLIFEDNYPAGYGDCHSLKKAWEKPALANRLKEWIDVYAEFPPIVAPPSTRFSTNWDQFDTPSPLVEGLDNPYSLDAQTYTWICYVRLN